MFFRETLSNLMMNHCTRRLKDSCHNSAQHMQPGLVKHMKIHGLKDNFLSVHGEDVIMYPRITATSKTRID